MNVLKIALLLLILGVAVTVLVLTIINHRHCKICETCKHCKICETCKACPTQKIVNLNGSDRAFTSSGKTIGCLDNTSISCKDDFPKDYMNMVCLFTNEKITDGDTTYHCSGK